MALKRSNLNRLGSNGDPPVSVPSDLSKGTDRFKPVVKRRLPYIIARMLLPKIDKEQYRKSRDIYNRLVELYNKRGGKGEMTEEEATIRRALFQATPNRGYKMSPYQLNQFPGYVDRFKEIDKDVEVSIGDFKPRRELKAKYLGLDDYIKVDGKRDIVKSDYVPTISKDENATYYRGRRVKFADEDLRKLYDAVGEVPKSGNSDILFSRLGGIPHPDALGELPKEPESALLKNIQDLTHNYGGLGTFTIGRGQDEKGKYVSVYDKWDLAPKQSELINVDINEMMNPIEIYDRYYLPNKNITMNKPKYKSGVIRRLGRRIKPRPGTLKYQGGGVGTLANLLGSGMTAFAQDPEEGTVDPTQHAIGTGLQLGAAGMSAGPIGGAVGFLVGTGIGAVTAKKQNEMAEEAKRAEELYEQAMEDQRSRGILANFETAGSNTNKRYYKCGGRKMKSGGMKYKNGAVDPGNIAMYDTILNRNKKLDFVQRIANPNAVPSLRNEDGTTSTHKMAADFDDKGDWYVYPRVVNRGGKLEDMKERAWDYAIESGERIKMPSRKLALDFAAGSYKRTNMAGGQFAQGGMRIPIAKDVDIAKGRTHEEGGIDIGGAEVENDEVAMRMGDSEIWFSDTLKTMRGKTFAEEAEKIAKQKAKAEEMEGGDRYEKGTARRNIQKANFKLGRLAGEQYKKQIEKGINPYGEYGQGGLIKAARSIADLYNQGFIRPPMDINKLETAGLDPLDYEVDQTIPSLNTQFDPETVDFYRGDFPEMDKAKSAFTPDPNAALQDINMQPTVNQKAANKLRRHMARKERWYERNKEYDTDQSGTLSAEEMKVKSEYLAAKRKEAGRALEESVTPMIDNITNIILTSKTPKVPLPQLRRAVPMKTKFSIDAPLADIRRGERTMVEGARRSTGDTPTTRAYALAARAQGLQAAGRLYTQKENIETQLENRQRMNLQRVDEMNKAAYDRYNEMRMQRQAGILSDISQNAANIVEDVRLQQRQKNQERMDMATIALLEKRFKDTGIFNRTMQGLFDKALQGDMTWAEFGERMNKLTTLNKEDK